jgi:predicted nucleic acid-binding protein
VIVVDASVIARALGEDDAPGESARARIRGERLAAPELIDLEVVSAWRRAARSRRLSRWRADRALAALAALPLVRASHAELMPRVWELRGNLSVYDAAYVALAEALGARLLTADRAMAAAPRLRCEVELLPAR